MIRKEETSGIKVVEPIPIDLITPNPYQPRRSFSAASIDELARSILRYGLIQPISVRRTREGGYELIAGERRLRASKRAGFTHINAIVYTAGEQESAVIALIENLQRENLHFFDEAEAYKNLLLEHGLTQEELARRIWTNQSNVANKLRILRLSPRVRSAINEGRLTERHARTLLRIRDEGTQLELIQRIRNEGLSVKETEDAVEKILDRLYEEEDPQPKQQRQSRRVGILRDGRLVVNSLQQLMEQFNSCGFESSYKMKDKGEFFEISIKVNKVQTKIRSVG